MSSTAASWFPAAQCASNSKLDAKGEMTLGNSGAGAPCLVQRCRRLVEICWRRVRLEMMPDMRAQLLPSCGKVSALPPQPLRPMFSPNNPFASHHRMLMPCSIRSLMLLHRANWSFAYGSLRMSRAIRIVCRKTWYMIEVASRLCPVIPGLSQSLLLVTRNNPVRSTLARLYSKALM